MVIDPHLVLVISCLLFSQRRSNRRQSYTRIDNGRNNRRLLRRAVYLGHEYANSLQQNPELVVYLLYNKLYNKSWTLKWLLLL